MPEPGGSTNQREAEDARRAAAAGKIAAPAASGFTPCQARLREADTTIAICNLPVGHEGRHIDSIRDEAWERGKVERMPAGAGENPPRLCGAVRGVPEQGGDVCTRPQGHPGNHIDDNHRVQWAVSAEKDVEATATMREDGSVWVDLPEAVTLREGDKLTVRMRMPTEPGETHDVHWKVAPTGDIDEARSLAAALEFRHRVRILLDDPRGVVARLEHGDDADAYNGRRLVEMLRGLDRACSPENSERPSEGKVEACDAQQPVDVARGRPGFMCSEKAGHEGDHIARGSDKRELARWPRGGPTDPLKAMVAAVSLPLYRERLEKLRRELVGTPDAHPNRHDIEDEIIRVEGLAFEAEKVVGVRG